MINIALSGETGADPVRARRRKARSESIDKKEKRIGKKTSASPKATVSGQAIGAV